MHSSRMRTGRALTVSPSMLCAGGGCTWSGRVPGLGGVYLVPGGVPGPGGCTCSRGVYLVLGGCTWSGGAPGPRGGVPGPGGCAWSGTTPPPPWTESQTPTLPQLRCGR